MKTALSVTIDEELNDALRAEAERQSRPLSWVVADALRTGLAKHGQDRATGPNGATGTKRVRT